MSTPGPDFNLREALLAMQAQVDVYATSATGNSTDVNVLGAVAENLLVALREAVEYIAEIDPARREETRKALSESDAWSICRVREEPGGGFHHVLNTYLRVESIVDLPCPTLEALLQHEDRNVCLEAIAAIGEGRAEKQRGRRR